jgi:hypothetical protein
MRPAWAERIPPAVSPILRTATIASGATTLFLQPSRERFGILLLPQTAGNVYWLPQFEANSATIFVGAGAFTNHPGPILFCDYGNLVWHGWYALHFIGVDTSCQLIEYVLPADAWAKLYSESITDMRPNPPYPA